MLVFSVEEGGKGTPPETTASPGIADPMRVMRLTRIMHECCVGGIR